jgi:hypothetical protein
MSNDVCYVGREGNMIQPPRTNSARPANLRQTRPFAGAMFALSCLFALIFTADICALLVTGKGAERRDFISYWAAGQQLAHNQDPYDAAATLHIERSLGFPQAGEALIVRNPPTALLLVAPLGYVSFRVAAVFWSLLLLACWIACLRILWELQGGSQTRFAVLGYQITPTFAVALSAPALACIFYGQTALFALLGFVLFLRFHQTRPFVAGLALWLCSLKPHLFLPFAVVLILWIAFVRCYGVLAGAIVALGASFAVARLLDPMAWQQYARMMQSVGLEREFIPCLSIALRFAVSRNSMWVQYVPAAAGCIWATMYYLRRRERWDWGESGPILVLVSMLVAPYAWITDQALAVPALLLVARRCSFGSLVILALLGSAIEAGILANLSMHSAFYLWTSPAWLAWYLLASPKGEAAELPIPAS